MELVTADIGGSHARFALADVEGGQVRKLGDAVTLKTVDHASLQTAWETFGEQLGRTLPRAAAIAVACPVSGEILKLTNNPWIIRPAMVAQGLGVDRITLINDFSAVGHGSGLGVAHVLRREGHNHVIECEGGHIDYAPVDGIEDVILARLRERYG